MRPVNEGCALVILYLDGRRVSVLRHPHDGGEAYMGPVLRKAVSYAKTHYESGDIKQVLLSEPEMEEIVTGDHAADKDARHLYYVTASWDPDAGRKTYGVLALHSKKGEFAGDRMPVFAKNIESFGPKRLI